MSAAEIDIRKILKLLPHRYPFLLVDRVLEFEAQKRIKTLKNVTGAWIKSQKVEIQNGKIREYRVDLKVTFVLTD